jgi:hypothetical protein
MLWVFLQRVKRPRMAEAEGMEATPEPQAVMQETVELVARLAAVETSR